MQPVTASNFGFLVAYLIPGYVVLMRTDEYLQLLPLEAEWSLGGLLTVTVVSLVYGMIISALRWLLIDFLHHATGIRPRRWCFSSLQANVNAYELIVRHQYQYYQFYSNMILAGVVVLAVEISENKHPILTMLVGTLILVLLFLDEDFTLRICCHGYPYVILAKPTN